MLQYMQYMLLYFITNIYKFYLYLLYIYYKHILKTYLLFRRQARCSHVAASNSFDLFYRLEIRLFQQLVGDEIKIQLRENRLRKKLDTFHQLLLTNIVGLGFDKFCDLRCFFNPYTSSKSATISLRSRRHSTS